MNQTGMSNLQWIMGTAQLTDVYGVANRRRQGMNEQEAIAFLDRAVELGIGGLDTAPGYGDSERVIGKWLQSSLQRQALDGSSVRPQLYTKLPGIGDEVSITDAPVMVRRLLKQSAGRLGIAPLDTILLHSVQNAFSHEGVVWQTLVEMKFAGHIREIGVSVYSPDELEAVWKLPDLGVVQIPFNLFDQRLLQGDWNVRAREQGVRLIARSIYLQGLLLLSPSEVPPSLQELAPDLEDLHRLAQDWNLTMEELALAFVAQTGLFDGIIFGCETMEQLERNMGIVRSVCTRSLLTEQQMSLIRQRFGSIPQQLIDPRQWRL